MILALEWAPLIWPAVDKNSGAPRSHLNPRQADRVMHMHAREPAVPSPPPSTPPPVTLYGERRTRISVPSSLQLLVFPGKTPHPLAPARRTAGIPDCCLYTPQWESKHMQDRPWFLLARYREGEQLEKLTFALFALLLKRQVGGGDGGAGTRHPRLPHCDTEPKVSWYEVKRSL